MENNFETILNCQPPFDTLNIKLSLFNLLSLSGIQNFVVTGRPKKQRSIKSKKLGTRAKNYNLLSAMRLPFHFSRIKDSFGEVRVNF